MFFRGPKAKSSTIELCRSLKAAELHQNEGYYELGTLRWSLLSYEDSIEFIALRQTLCQYPPRTLEQRPDLSRFILNVLPSIPLLYHTLPSHQVPVPISIIWLGVVWVANYFTLITTTSKKFHIKEKMLHYIQHFYSCNSWWAKGCRK